MRRTSGASELLDGPLEDRTVRGNLRDLARVNRWLGGSELSWRSLRNVLKSTEPGARLSILDVGTGGADIPIELVKRARQAGRAVRIIATDIRPEVVTIARESSAAIDELEVRRVSGALADEQDNSFDVVHASLVVHHHDPDAARTLLAEFARVTCSVVIVNDLERGWTWWAGAWLLSHLFTGNRYTRHDAALSVRRAYTADEVSDMARGVGLHEVGRQRSRPGYRYALTFVVRQVP